MMMKSKLRMFIFGLSMVLAVFGAELSGGANAQATNAHLKREVRHELVTLPYYGVFDWLQYEVRPDNTVVLRGQVVRPSTKSQAETRVKQIEGVSRVINEIETLPLSPSDDRLRTALYRALYNFDSPLFRYATQSVPSIHIVVANGHAILKGIVDSKSDADLANVRARSVPGLFDVKNELTTESEMPK
jgi:hyperosmotically inducible protein